MTIDLLRLIPGAQWKHPNARLQSAWLWARVGLVIFPLIPAVGAILLAVALVKTWRQAGSEIYQQRLNWCLAILSPWLLVVALFSPQPGDALLGTVNFLPFFAFFAAYSILIESPAQLRQLAWIFLIPALPMMLLGLGQMCGWGAILPTPGISASTIWTLRAGGEPLGRMSALFAHANPLAAYLQMVFIFALGLSADLYDRQRQGVPELVKTRWWRSASCWWLLAILGLCTLSLLLTSSRAAWSIAIASSLVFTIYQSWYWIVGILSAIGTIILSAAYAPPPLKAPLRSFVPRYLWARITDEMYPDRPTEITRLSQWKFAWEMTRSRPVTGWGLQSFGPLYQAATHVWLGYPHNLLLMLSSNLGIPATIAIFGFVGWILMQGTRLFLNFPLQWRSERTIFFTYLVAFVGFMIFNIADVTALELRLNALAWLLLASICGLVDRAKN